MSKPKNQYKVLHNPHPTIYLNGERPLCFPAAHICKVLPGETMVKRLRYAAKHYPELGWLKIIEQGSDHQVDTFSVELAYQRILAGERPPLLPSEIKREQQKLASHSREVSDV
jgi:hypothetical protein